MKNEELLIERTLELGDARAFSLLVEMHQGKIRSFLVRLCKNYDYADDLAQETFIKAFEKLNTFEGKGKFQGWLFSIAYNCFIQQERSNKRRQEITDNFKSQFVILKENYESISSEQIDLERAISQLNEKEAASVTLCHSYRYSHQEVAEILELPVGTVKSNILRGKSKLKIFLDLNDK